MSASTLSSTTVVRSAGDRADVSAASAFGSAAVPAVTAASVRGSIDWVRLSAMAIAASSTAGSSSPSSTDTQATRRCWRVAHWARSVVLP